MNIDKIFSTSILFGMVYNKKSFINHCARNNVSATMFCSPHSKGLLQDVLKGRSQMKKYFITKSTSQRIDKVPVGKDKFSKGFFSHLSNADKEIGFVCMSDKLHFLYVIDGLSVKILVCKGGSKVADNAEYKLMNSIRGFIYIDLFSTEGFVNPYINNILDLFENKDHLLAHEKASKNQLNIIKKNEFTAIKYQEDYKDKQDDVKKCLQCFVFMKYAKVYDETLISVDIKTRNKYSIPKEESSIIKIDSFWDKNIDVINPFGVSGHYRDQPHGAGRKLRKTIYIDGFMKSGYSRKATMNN